MKLFFTFLLLGLSVINGKTCTTFCIKDSNTLIYAKNFDYFVDFGQVHINKRNVRKFSLVLPPEKPFEWISKYGSVTFNQCGREFPYGGINEKGLVIEQMKLDETIYPSHDERNGLTELQWIQYQLDNSSSVEDVINSDKIVRISKQSLGSLHFFICDSKGVTGIIEFINGTLIYHYGHNLPVNALTNDAYGKSRAYLKKLNETGQINSHLFTQSSLDRFARTANLIERSNNQDKIKNAFTILKTVDQGNFTKWSIVYDIKNMTVYFQTIRNKDIRKIDVNGYDFSCDTKSLYIDIDAKQINNQLDFKEYSYKSNRELIDNVCNNVISLQSLPESIRESYAKYPEKTRCN